MTDFSTTSYAGSTINHDGTGSRPENFDLPEDASRQLRWSEVSASRDNLYTSDTRQLRSRVSDGPYHCRICQRTYERPDHLSRHMKSHENARPFSCPKCSKSFNRVDLLNRHVLAHERNSNGVVEFRRSDRVSKACVACAASKARCEDKKPCRRCQKRNIVCETSSPSHRNVHESHESASLEALNDTMPALDGIAAIDPDLTQAASIQPTVAFHMDAMDMSSLPEGFEGIMGDMPFLAGLSDFNNQILDFGFQDFDFPDKILDFQSASASRRASIDAGVLQDQGDSAPPARDATRGHAAFMRSPWLWTPGLQDRVLKDQGHLVLDESHISPASLSGLTVQAGGGVAHERIPRLLPAMRDKMLYLVSTMNRYTSGIPDYPSLDILNPIIEAFFVRQSYQVDYWIHAPTVIHPDVSPEFLTALVSGGSAVISVPAIWKMGLVLQDVVRVTVGELWERDNKKTRQLQPLQAWMVSLDTGLWSGYQRPMELAESFLQPLVTMMRRGGVFASSSYTQNFAPTADDTGTVLETKWRRWLERESFKRLAIHLFLHDTRASIALQKNALLSLTELSMPLPAPRILFIAETAVEWKYRCLEIRYATQSPTLRLLDIVQNFRILGSVAHTADTNLCYTAILHGFWSQIWSLQASTTFHAVGEKKHSVHALWLTTQQRELVLQIEALEDKLLTISAQVPELLLTVELFLMILHVNPEDLQRFAGKSGEEAASESLDVLESWSITTQSRRAVWHAAQVFRWAAFMPPAELRDFYAIAVYFASLAMWAYGHVSPLMKGLATQNAEGSTTESSLIFIDGDETRETRAFISQGEGMPAIMSSGMRGSPETSPPSVTMLSHPNRVLEKAGELYRSNFPVLEEPLPPLVNNMRNLLRDLSCLPESRFSRAPSPLG